MKLLVAGGLNLVTGWGRFTGPPKSGGGPLPPPLVEPFPMPTGNRQTSSPSVLFGRGRVFSAERQRAAEHACVLADLGFDLAGDFSVLGEEILGGFAAL